MTTTRDHITKHGRNMTVAVIGAEGRHGYRSWCVCGHHEDATAPDVASRAMDRHVHQRRIEDAIERHPANGHIRVK